MKPGDKVICVNDDYAVGITLNEIYTVLEIVSPNFIKIIEDVYGFPWAKSRFQLYNNIDYLAITRSVV